MSGEMMDVHHLRVCMTCQERDGELAAARARIAELERVCQTALDFYALPTLDWVARYGAGMTTRDLGDMFRAALRTQEAEA